MLGKIKKLKKGIIRTMVTTLLMFGVIPMSIMGGIYIIFHIQNQKRLIYNTQMEMTSRLSYEISSYIKKNKQNVEFFGAILSHNFKEKTLLRDIAYDLIYQTGEFDVVELFDRSGKRLFKLAKYYNEELMAHDHGNYKHRLNSVLKGMSIISDVEFIGKGMPYIYIMSPIVDVWNIIKGAIVIHMNLNNILRKINTFNQGKRGIAYIISRNGRLISFSGLSNSEEGINNIESIKRFMKNGGGVNLYRGLDGSWVIGAISPCSVSGIGVVVETPVLYAFRSLYIFLILFVIVLLLTILSSIILGVKFSIRNLIWPLQELKERAKKISQGEFDTRIELNRDDELQDLAETFNSMARELKEKTVSKDILLKEIEERKEIEKSLRISEERYRKIFENTGTATLLIDKDLTILMANTEFEKLSGYRREELENRLSLSTFFVEEDLYPIRSFISDSKESSLRYELNFKDKMLNEKEIFAQIMVLEADRTYIISITDISPIRRAERLFTDMVKHTRIGLFIIQDGRIVLVNPQFEKSSGYKNQELVGKESLFLVHPDDREIVHRYAIDMLKGKRSVPYEYRAVRKDGEIRWIMESVTSIMYEGKRAVFGNHIDITDKKHMEQDLLRIQKLESLGTLAGGLSHDFNNILTTIMGNISLAKIDIEPDTRLYKLLDEAESATYRAKELTNRFTTFSEGGYGIRKSISIGDIIKDAIDITLSGSNINTDVSIPPNIWHVDVDPNQMIQVINNLLLNAKESMENRPGTVRITAENVHIEEDSPYPLRPGRYVKVSISDEGKGIPEIHLSRIFDPYFSTKKRGTQKGMGLGLTLVHSIIKRHGGYVYVESKYKYGSTFSFFLPASRNKKDGTLKDIMESRSSTTSEGKQLRVLIMDDEIMIRRLAKEMLIHMGYDVETAKNGEEAIELYKKSKMENREFDLIILDLTVKGGMGGKEAIREIRNINPDVIAIVTSGYSNDPVLTDYNEYGFNAAIAKPFTISTLKAEIEKILGT